MRDDLRFDQLLREDAAGLPPAMAVVNPWRDAMDLVLWGIGLTTITLNFLYLALILPLLGAILMVLGFRTLRRENRALRACYGLSIVLAVMRSLNVVLPALPVDTGVVTGYVIAALTLALYVCLWRGMVGVSRAAGAEKPTAPAAGALVNFYVALFLLAMLQLQGWLAVLPLLVVYLVILRNLVKLSRSLADMGYTIHAAPVRLPSAAVLWGYLGATLAALLLALFLCQRLPMDWQARDDAPQDVAVRAQLLELGFPQQVLDDLTAEEVARMSGAVKVYTEEDPLYGETYQLYETEDPVEEDAHPGWVLDGWYNRSDGRMCYRYRVYEAPQSVMTHIAVELPEQYGEKRYWLLHYLDYTLPLLEPRYTEMLEVWKVEQMSEGWRSGSVCEGRLLCDRDGQALTADLYELTGNADWSSDFFGTSFAQSTITARWTQPAHGENVRLYVLYDAFRQEEGNVLTETVNYLRQHAPVYPAAQGAEDLWRQRRSDAVTWRQPSIQVWLYELEEQGA